MRRAAVGVSASPQLAVITLAPTVSPPTQSGDSYDEARSYLEDERQLLGGSRFRAESSRVPPIWRASSIQGPRGHRERRARPGSTMNPPIRSRAASPGARRWRCIAPRGSAPFDQLIKENRASQDRTCRANSRHSGGSSDAVFAQRGAGTSGHESHDQVRQVVPVRVGVRSERPLESEAMGAAGMSPHRSGQRPAGRSGGLLRPPALEGLGRESPYPMANKGAELLTAERLRLVSGNKATFTPGPSGRVASVGRRLAPELRHLASLTSGST